MLTKGYKEEILDLLEKNEKKGRIRRHNWLALQGVIFCPRGLVGSFEGWNAQLNSKDQDAEESTLKRVGFWYMSV